jgi:hypothetical protein
MRNFRYRPCANHLASTHQYIVYKKAGAPVPLLTTSMTHELAEEMVSVRKHFRHTAHGRKPHLLCPDAASRFLQTGNMASICQQVGLCHAEAGDKCLLSGRANRAFRASR